MRLIHYSQIGDINISKISGLVQLAEQRVIASEGQTNFLLTILESGNYVVKAEFEVNGIPYEIAEENYQGDFERNGFSYLWTKTEANGGFDIEEGMTVVLRAYYYKDKVDVPLNTKIVEIDGLARRTQVIGSTDDMSSYFEIFDLSDIDIEELLGVNINSALYSHPNLISYNSTSKELTISGIVIDAYDHMAIVINTI